MEKVHPLSITPDTVLFKHNILPCLFTCLFLPVSKNSVLVQRKHSSNHYTAREVPDTALTTLVPLNFRHYLKHENTCFRFPHRGLISLHSRFHDAPQLLKLHHHSSFGYLGRSGWYSPLLPGCPARLQSPGSFR